ncbi:MAG: YlbF family regulator [Smithella sp.]
MGAENLSLVEKARTLAKILASSEEFEEYYISQQKFKSDPEARAILEEFDRKQQLMNSGVSSGREIFNELTKLQDKIRSNGTIMDYLQAEQAVTAIIREVNDIITDAAGFDFGQNSSTNTAC